MFLIIYRQPSPFQQTDAAALDSISLSRATVLRILSERRYEQPPPPSTA